jgi:hypothetical protein
MINKPHIITIKLFTTGNLPTNAELEAMLSQQCFNFSLLSVDLSPMRFDGVGLVPVRTQAEPAEAKPAKPKAKSSPDPKTAKKEIHFEPGSDAEKIWHLLRDGAALTSTQVREKLNLKSGIVNTTIYRLKNAGMIRPMSHTAINGDTLYTTTHLDAKE